MSLNVDVLVKLNVDVLVKFLVNFNSLRLYRVRVRGREKTIARESPGSGSLPELLGKATDAGGVGADVAAADA